MIFSLFGCQTFDGEVPTFAAVFFSAFLNVLHDCKWSGTFSRTWRRNTYTIIEV